MAPGQGRAHEGARAEKSDPAGGLVQLGIVTAPSLRGAGLVRVVAFG